MDKEPIKALENENQGYAFDDDEQGRGQYAIEVIRCVMKELEERYEEIKADVARTGSQFDTGLMSGYRFALDILEDQVNGIIFPYPNAAKD